MINGMQYQLNPQTLSSIRRQVPFLIGGTVTGIIMTYYMGFIFTIVVNSIVWYVVTLMVYRLIWRKNALIDQMTILRYILTKLKSQNSIEAA